jgi:hypothetical protein
MWTIQLASQSTDTQDPSRTLARLVRTNKLKTGKPSALGFVAAIICSRMAIISCCLAYCDRICGGTLALPFFMVNRAAFDDDRAVSHRPVINTEPPNDETRLLVVQANPVVRKVSSRYNRKRSRLIMVVAVSMKELYGVLTWNKNVGRCDKRNFNDVSFIHQY